MRKILTALALAAATLCSHPATADTVDVATVKCSDLAGMGQEEGTFLFVWILGYLGGQAGATTLDLSEMESFGKSVGEYCAANPDVGVLSAAADAAGD